VPLRIRLTHDAHDKELTIVKGEVASVALPRVSTSARGDPVFAGLGEVVDSTENGQKGWSCNLNPPWNGPYRIVDKPYEGVLAYCVRINKNRKGGAGE